MRRNIRLPRAFSRKVAQLITIPPVDFCLFLVVELKISSVVRSFVFVDSLYFLDFWSLAMYCSSVEIKLY